ncbi:MAG: penicillin-binding transpeptidase domain-containing protein, partial [Clostridiales bacterium]
EEKYGTIAESAKSDELIVVETASGTADYEYPWFIDHVISESAEILTGLGFSSSSVYSGGLHIYTTLNQDVQTAMESAFANEDNFPTSKTGDLVESGMVIIDPATGAVRGVMGGRVYETKRGFNRGTDLRRSSGSTIKPLVAYGPAVELGYGAGYAINDSPIPGNYSPNNSDRAFQGRISMRRAIMGSRNVCAVRMLATIGADVGWSYGIKLGLPLVPQDANLSLTLGGLTYGVAPIEMAGAFAAFANEGIFIKPYCVSRIEDARGKVLYTAQPEHSEVFSADTAYIVTDMLMSAVSSGTGTNAKLSGWQTAGKTGTNELPSKEDPDYRGLSGTKDAWFVGYTPVLVGAVWMGYDNKWDENHNIQYLKNIYGGTYPARLWKSVMSEALNSYEVTTFTKPSTVVGATIDTKSGMTPSELTPSQFIGSEIYSSSALPSGPSDIWEKVEICEDSGRLAGAYCPNKAYTVKIKRDENDPPSEKAADYGLYAPSSTCTLHSSYQSGLNNVSICTDPRHHGEKVLATTGCPSEYVATRYYAPGYAPTTYCTLEDHKGSPLGGGGGDSGSGSGGSLPWHKEDEDDDDSDSVAAISSLNKPTDVGVSVSGSSATITWSSDNNSATTKFIVERTSDGDSSTQVRFVVYGNSCTDNTIESGHKYGYRVYAYNEQYSVISPWSSTVSISN